MRFGLFLIIKIFFFSTELFVQNFQRSIVYSRTRTVQFTAWLFWIVIIRICLFCCMWIKTMIVLWVSLYIVLAKPNSGARIFFPRTSQGHNALPRPGLELGLSDSEPSALTTGLLNKAVALACPWYSHTTKFFQLDGLLLFCIIMGLRSASSAISGSSCCYLCCARV